ncbi:MAG: Teichoic acids export ATP-binding protein TagH [Syntrophorhabdus sp. PtaB.Bin027]|nr:MAG: Teichoic acids export ATP-binding protein TagH [Syntrophorhabdus sp. PtaB.Bin027]
MSDDIAIRVRGLGKKYQIGGPQEKYLTIRDAISYSVKTPFRRLCYRGVDNLKREIWALNNVSFDVKKGEVVGIIGRNGAGKSTLLKILSRITTPTEGEVDIYGRVGALLEVGTGFHPELTGRENIFLTGSILGMRKQEIEEKFDEIIKFAEIEKFLDTPAKRYSSGMYVRLGFSVAAHLEPEILLVDEVLAVGDASFQKKCLGKLGDVASEGRTVLFVSHNMGAIKKLCTRALLIESGNLVEDGITSEVITHYLDQSGSISTNEDIDAIISKLPPDPTIRLENIEMYQEGIQVFQTVENGIPLEIVITYEVFERTHGMRVYFDLMDSDENLLFRSFHDEQSDTIPVMEKGRYKSRATIPADILGPINYEIRLRATIYNVRTCIPSPIRIPINVTQTGNYNKSYPGDTFRGKLGLCINWDTKKIL